LGAITTLTRFFLVLEVKLRARTTILGGGAGADPGESLGVGRDNRYFIRECLEKQQGSLTGARSWPIMRLV
jgi:hypothetical protein